jgi:putative MATE family efflux protein
MNETNNLTEGSILRSIVSLSIPIIIANLLQTAYQLIDTLWVGRIGATAVAAVSISFPILFLILSLGGGLGIAGTVLVAQYKGMNDKKNVDKVSEQTVLMMVGLAIMLSVVGYFLTPIIIRLMGAEPDVFTGAVSYLRISFIGVIFLFGYFVFQSLLRGFGDAKTPMYIVLLTVILNAVLDPLFIFGWGIIPALGVAGAALATIMTQAIASIIGIGILFTGRYGIHLKKENLKPDFALMKRIFKLGFPTSIEQSMRALGFTLMTVLVATFGTITLASYGIGTRIQSFVVIPALSLSFANSALIGQNLGAGKPERASKITLISMAVGFLVLTFIGILFFIFSNHIVRAFIPNDPQVIAAGAQLLRIISLFFGFIGLQMALFGTFRGAGKTGVAMVFAIITLVVQFSFAFFLSKFTPMGDIGLWWAFPISNVIGAAIALWWFFRGTWKKGIPENIPECDIIEA